LKYLNINDRTGLSEVWYLLKYICRRFNCSCLF